MNLKKYAWGVLALVILFAAASFLPVNAQTTSTTPIPIGDGPADTSAPGLPDTGLGNNSYENLFIALAILALVAGAGTIVKVSRARE